MLVKNHDNSIFHLEIWKEGKELNSYITAKRNYLSRLHMHSAGFKSMTLPSTQLCSYKVRSCQLNKILLATTNRNLSCTKLKLLTKEVLNWFKDRTLERLATRTDERTILALIQKDTDQTVTKEHNWYPWKLDHSTKLIKKYFKNQKIQI